MGSMDLASDRRSRNDRRRNTDRRSHHAPKHANYRCPSWQEQKVQFYTRYVFLFLGLLFFNFLDVKPASWSLTNLNIAYTVYLLVNTLIFLHASRHHIYPPRYHLAMWVDIVIATITIFNDPNPIPPTLLVYIMVVLGNGMRYGMRMFAESLLLSFFVAMLVLAARHVLIGYAFSAGLLFLNIIGGIILVYSYILMGRIERGRKELELRSCQDTLTGLLNRGALQAVADTMFQRLQHTSSKFVMLFADLDNFKAVNDELGHAAGDRVLKEFSGIACNCVRESDTVARYGGDEFVMLLEDVSMQEAESIAVRIQEKVATWSSENGMDVSVSFGLGEAETHGIDFDSLLETVDKALYQSKAACTGNGIAHAQATDAVSP